MLPIDLLEGFERKMASIHNRPACNIDIAPLPEAYDGVTSIYIKEENHIIFNEKNYYNVSEIEIIGALFREIRHAYQYHILTTTTYNQEPKEVIDQWKKDFESYIQPISLCDFHNKDSNQYMIAEEQVYEVVSTSIEIDALAYADLNVYHIYKVHLDMPDKMKDLVIKRQEQIKDRNDIIKM
ncbi:hypothetical protein KHQ88_04325 [Mycoplasmatota bacterium]|nr:hypothetical protein KHQ88_04325 [Mycoplasmatota bacterium]